MKVKVTRKYLPRGLRAVQNFLRRAELSAAGSGKWHKVYFNQDPCVYCGKTKKERKRWTIEHVLPIAEGGKDRDNTVHCCYSCNINRSNIPLLLWLVCIRINEGDTTRAVKSYWRKEWTNNET
jgi:hypothetical protein